MRPVMRHARPALAFCLASLLTGAAQAAMTLPDYLAEVFPNQVVPASKSLWLTPPVRIRMEEILGHPIRMPRLPYWQSGTRTVWVMNEIGKEQPITIGVVIETHRIRRVDILEYRESRGDEVRYPAFRRQFTQARLIGKDRLDKDIQGISGATLSVWAVTRVTRAALAGAEIVTPAEAGNQGQPPQSAR